MKYVYDILIGFVFCAFFFTLGIVLMSKTDAVYYSDIHMLNMSSTLQTDEVVIKMCYDSVKEYISDSDLQEPDILVANPSSDAIDCIKQVKKLIGLAFMLMVILGIICCFLVIWKSRINDSDYLLLAAITQITLSMIMIFNSIFAFNNFFDGLRNLLFGGTSWKLNSVTDEIVLYFPTEYFQHCFILISFFVLLLGCGIFLIYLGINSKKVHSEQ